MNEIDIEDIIFIIGIGLFGYGLYILAPWISYTLLGVILMFVGYMRAGGDN